MVAWTGRGARASICPDFGWAILGVFGQAWMAQFGQGLTGSETVPELRQKLISSVLAFGESVLTEESNLPEVARIMSKHFKDVPITSTAQMQAIIKDLLQPKANTPVTVDGVPTLADDPYSYFGWIPPLDAQVIPGAAAVTFSTDCWDYSATATQNSNGSVALAVTVSNQKVLFCSDLYLLGTVETLMITSFDTEGTHAITWDPSANRTAAELYDLKKKGTRMFGFTNNTLETIVQIIDTALLFLPELINPVDPGSAARNQYFMRVYAQQVMNTRATQVVTVDESTIQSGDFFGIIRYATAGRLAFAACSVCGCFFASRRSSGVRLWQSPSVS